jgi:crotonobetainyl-CoA:carnitine CoA-transferase CaiB-like acyl-CoA transferase
MMQGLLAMDPWAWMLGVIARRYPDAYTEAPLADYEAGIPNSPIFFRLLVGLSKDGRWMQFSQTTERLWQAFLRVTGLDEVLADPKFKDAPISEDPDVRVAFWEKALAIVRDRTYDEWLRVFDEDTDVWAETYRAGSEALHHPQMVFDQRTVVLEDAAAGPVLQPGPLVQMDRTPARLDRGAPALDEHASDVRNRSEPSRRTDGLLRTAAAGPPLDGVTIVELGTFFAGPFGAGILAELGARVIKVEPLEGDSIRWVMPFPEVGGVKAMQGKESIAVDMRSEEGRKVVLELVRRADAVLQSFRAGVADRHGYSANDLLAVNPNLVYLNAPGYGIGGPMGHRPAFAPTIGAASGLGYRNIGGRENVPQRADLTPDEVKRYSLRLGAATMGVGHADGFSALGTATALLLGLLGRQRLGVAQAMSTSMLSTMAHTLSEDVVEYADRPEAPRPDRRLLGLGPLWRLYETAKGWVFLAAPSGEDWAAVASVLDLPDDLRDRPDVLEAALEDRFRSKSASEWETALVLRDVACAEVVAGPLDAVFMPDGALGERLGIVVKRNHEVLGEYPRLGPLVCFSRSNGVIGEAPVCGRHTEAILTELGYQEQQIEALRAAQVIGG